MPGCGSLLDSLALSIRCRQCGAIDTDDYEVVAANMLHSMRCSGCGSVMQFALLECPACGAETLFPWQSQPASTELANLVCAACERRLFDEAPGPPAFA